MSSLRRCVRHSVKLFAVLSLAGAWVSSVFAAELFTPPFGFPTAGTLICSVLYAGSNTTGRAVIIELFERRIGVPDEMFATTTEIVTPANRSVSLRALCPGGVCGDAYCRFDVEGSARQYRVQGCVQEITSDSVLSACAPAE
jgi:hypothetical protein